MTRRRVKRPKELSLDATSWPFVSVKEIMSEAIRLAKSKRAMIILTYNNKVLTVNKNSDVGDLVKEYFV
jgi:hypothetical protein